MLHRGGKNVLSYTQSLLQTCRFSELSQYIIQNTEGICFLSLICGGYIDKYSISVTLIYVILHLAC